MKRVLCFLALITIVPTVLSAQCKEGNCFDGKGVFIFKSGSRYEGNFKDGKIHDYGTLFFSDGRKYTGQWHNQMRHGKGVMKYEDKSSYVGSFTENNRHGFGKITIANGDVYEGNWEDDRIMGNGKYVFKSGHIYSGNFVDGIFEGYGEMIYPDGSRYKGKWKHNQKHGTGTFINSQGISQSGSWKEGEFESSNGQVETTVDLSASNENKVDRDCNKVNCENGVGRFTFKDGSYYVGEFQKNIPDGVGICHYSNGDRYEGSWKNNGPEGEGTIYFENGTSYKAIWKDGNPVKKHSGKSLEKEKNKAAVTMDSDNSKDDVRIWAVIVGIAGYNHMPTLKYTDDDAYHIYAFLKSPEGGAIPNERISILIDEAATHENILGAMESTFAQANENDVVILYYSGHGVEGSFLPYDFDGKEHVLAYEEVKDMLGKSKAKHKILFADACHSGSMLAMKNPHATSPGHSLLMEFEKVDGGTAIFTSSKSEEISMETSGLRQGIFSHFLIRGLSGEADNNMNNIVEMEELYNFVYTGVRQYTQNRQSPLIAGDFDPKMPLAFLRR